MLALTHNGRSRARKLGLLAAVALLVLAACSSAFPPIASELDRSHAFEVTTVMDRIAPAAPEEYAFFGSAVDLEGATMVVGAWGEADLGRNTGAAYVFDLSQDGPPSAMRLASSDAQAGARFGHAVAVAGETVLVSAVYQNVEGARRSGEVKVFARDGETWREATTLVPQTRSADAYFGSALAVDGDVAVIGAAGPSAHTAHIFVRSGAQWTEQAVMAANADMEQSRFGGSVAVSGDTALVGSWLVPNEFDDPMNGSVYVYRRVNDMWEQEAVLVSPEDRPIPDFGRSVAIDGDVAVVGAAGGEPVYVFERRGTTWHATGVLTTEVPIEGSHFGVAVAIDGDTIAVGATGIEDHAGSAYIFRRTADGWSGQRRLTAEASPKGLELGGTLALDGETLAIGAAGDSTGGIASGSAFLHQLR